MRQRRRLVREELFAVLVLLAALVVTVAVLANQWLGSPSTSGSGLPAHLHLALNLLGGST